MKKVNQQTLSDLPGQVPPEVAARLSGGCGAPETTPLGQDGTPMIDIEDGAATDLGAGPPAMTMTFSPGTDIEPDKTEAGAKIDTGSKERTWYDWAADLVGGSDIPKTDQSVGPDTGHETPDHAAKDIERETPGGSEQAQSGDNASHERDAAELPAEGLGGKDASRAGEGKPGDTEEGNNSVQDEPSGDGGNAATVAATERSESADVKGPVPPTMPGPQENADGPEAAEKAPETNNIQIDDEIENSHVTRPERMAADEGNGTTAAAPMQTVMKGDNQESSLQSTMRQMEAESVGMTEDMAPLIDDAKVPAANSLGSEMDIYKEMLAVQAERTSVIGKEIHDLMNNLVERQDWLRNATAALSALGANFPTKDNPTVEMGRFINSSGIEMDVIQFMKDNGVPIAGGEGSDKKYLKGEIEQSMQNMRTSIDKASSNLQMDQIRLQGMIETMEKLYPSVTNTMAKLGKTMNNIIGNTR